jgi:hypothetical protein
MRGEQKDTTGPFASEVELLVLRKLDLTADNPQTGLPTAAIFLAVDEDPALPPGWASIYCGVCRNRHDGMNEYEAGKTLAWHIPTADYYWETNDETLLQIMTPRRGR